MGRRVFAALTWALLVMAPLTTAETVLMKRSPRPTRPVQTQPDLTDASRQDSPFTAGIVRPAGIEYEDVPIIGGPETLHPDVEATYPPELPTQDPELPAPSQTALVADSPSLPSQNAETMAVRPNVSQTGNKVSDHPTPHPASTTGPIVTGTPKEPPMQTQAPTVSQLPISTPPTTKPSPPPSMRGAVAPADSTTLPPQPQTPQAIESAIARPEKTWPVIVFISGIAAVAVVIVLLLWRDTRFPKRRTSQDGTMSIPNKASSGELEYDWYASSPSLSSTEHSVDTFMGRQQVRMQSDPHVSSRAASTVDLLNVSTVGERSTGSNSNRTTRSQPIREEQEGDIKSFHASIVAAFRSRETLPRGRNESDDSASPQISFDDELNALSNWSGSDMDASVQAIFDEHHRTFLQSQGRSAAYTARGSAAFSPTSTGGGDDFESDHRDSDDDDDGSSSSDDEDVRASERGLRRYSNGSAYSAVPSFSTAILGECSFVSSSRSDWSDLTLPASDRGSRQSLESQDELL